MAEGGETWTPVPEESSSSVREEELSEPWEGEAWSMVMLNLGNENRVSEFRSCEEKEIEGRMEESSNRPEKTTHGIGNVDHEGIKTPSHGWTHLLLPEAQKM